jgi:hypothetical protein
MGSYNNHDEDVWSSRDFDEGAAAEWMSYGFYNPATAQEWASVVEDPAEAAWFHRLGIDPASAGEWVSIASHQGHDFRMEEAFNSVDGNARLALSYDKHFHVDDWAHLYEAGVSERAVASVAHLVSAVESRSIDSSVQPDRAEAINEAVRWLGSGSDYSLTRTNLLQNMILRGMEMRDVQFVLLDQDSSVSADDAIRANKWAEEAKFEYDTEGVNAYRLLAHTPEANSKEFAALLKAHGVRTVVSALGTGLTNVSQLEHYLRHGGVVEISRGVL